MIDRDARMNLVILINPLLAIGTFQYQFRVFYKSAIDRRTDRSSYRDARTNPKSLIFSGIKTIHFFKDFLPDSFVRKVLR